MHDSDLQLFIPSSFLLRNFYRVHDCNDSLPKYMNFPEPFGGDGKVFAEESPSKGACAGCIIS